MHIYFSDKKVSKRREIGNWETDVEHLKSKISHHRYAYTMTKTWDKCDVAGV